MDVEVEQLPKNNHPPSEETLVILQSLLAGPRHKLAESEKEIDRLRGLLNIAHKTLESAEEGTRDYRILLSSFRRIPIDVLYEIFLHCRTTHRNPIMSTSEAPILLTHVCSSWRSIALSFPQLWSRIHINFGHSYPGPTLQLGRRYIGLDEALQVRCNAITDWFGRSGSCPLSISIFHSGPDESILDGQVEDARWSDASTLELFQYISSLSRRWEEIELVMPIGVYCKLEKMLSSDRIDALRIVRITFDYESDDGYRLSRFPFYGSHSRSLLLKGPNLQIIVLGEQTRMLSTPTLSSWTHLLYFSSHYSPISSADALTFLQQCRRLVHLKLQLLPSTVSPEMLQIDNKISLPDLLSIFLVGIPSERDTTADFLSYIDAPNIIWISYHYPDRTSPQIEAQESLPPFPLLPLLETSKIQCLILDPRMLSNSVDELTSIFRLSANVTHIVIAQETEGEIATGEEKSILSA